MRNNLPCLPLIVERFVNAAKKHLAGENRYVPDCAVQVFPQVWGSTALGFGGIGGQALTTAYTTVVSDRNKNWHGVFFGDEAAYLVSDPNELFFEDIKKHRMASCDRCSQYNKEAEDG